MCSLEEFKKIIAGQSEYLAKQRSEDLLKFSEMIKTSVRSEVQDLVGPIEKRQEDFETFATQKFNDNEKRQEDFKKFATQQFSDIAKELIEIRQNRDVPQPSQTTNQRFPPPPTRPPPPTQTGRPACFSPSEENPGYEEVSHIIETAERTIGFKPIHKSDLTELCRIHNISDEQQGLKLLIIEYLKFEMKNSLTQPENIVRVFPPAKPDWDILYAEFDSLSTVNTVYRFTRFLRHSSLKVIMYVPHMFYDQFNHLSNIAHKYRMPPSSHKTRIKFGTENLYLQVKAPGGHAWQVVQVRNLPPLASHNPPAVIDLSPSPAPGRVRESGNKRAASSSPPSLRSVKAAKPNASDDILVDVENDDPTEVLVDVENDDPTEVLPPTVDAAGSTDQNLPSSFLEQDTTMN